MPVGRGILPPARQKSGNPLWISGFYNSEGRQKACSDGYLSLLVQFFQIVAVFNGINAPVQRRGPVENFFEKRVAFLGEMWYPD
jgi:hypothetical protein